MNQPQKVLKIRVTTNTKPQMRIHSSVLKMLMPPLCVVHRYSGMMTGKPYSSRLLMIRMMAQMRILRLVTRMVAPSASSLSCSLRLRPSPLTTLFFGTKKKHMSVPTMEKGNANQNVLYSPNTGMMKLGRYAPNTPMPNEKQVQKKPVAEASLDGEMYCAISTTKL